MMSSMRASGPPDERSISIASFVCLRFDNSSNSKSFLHNFELYKLYKLTGVRPFAVNLCHRHLANRVYQMSIKLEAETFFAWPYLVTSSQAPEVV